MPPSSTAHRVAVYGTLKFGFANHGLLRHACYLGETLLHDITLYDLGWFPAAKLELSGGILAEVYGVDEDTLAILDHLEGFRPEDPERSLFLRHAMETPLGEAWVYIYNHPVDEFEPMRRGSWQPAH